MTQSDLSKSFVNLNQSDLDYVKINKRRKVLILGGPGVGKSAVLIRYTEDKFYDAYIPSIQTKFKKILQFDNENVELEIIDIDGQTEYTIFSFSRFSFGIHGYILAYSIESRQSFELIKIIHSKLSSLVGRDIPKILISNKNDLEKKRAVSFEEGKKLATQMNCPFIECSAKLDTSNNNIEKVFHSVLVEIDKFENNIDFKELGCKKIFECFIKYENKITFIVFLAIIFYMLFGGFYTIYGFILGITTDADIAIYGGSLLNGLWILIFGTLGFYGMCKKRKEFVNYYSIGLGINLLILIGLMIILELFSEGKTETVPKQAIYIINSLCACLQMTLLFTSCIFQKMYKDELSTYMIV